MSSKTNIFKLLAYADSDEEGSAKQPSPNVDKVVSGSSNDDENPSRFSTSKKSSRAKKQQRTFCNEQVSILTFNVLADHLCKPAWFPYRSKDELDWRVRREHIKGTIMSKNADIICLQEIQIFSGPEHLRGNDHHLSWFDNWLRLEGYTGCFGARANASGKTAQGVQMGNLLYWKESKFEPILVESSVPLVRTLANELKGDKEMKSIFCNGGVRGTVACIVALRCFSSGRIIVVSTTHLPAPRSDSDGGAKLEQVLHACAWLLEISKFLKRVQPGVDALFLCGDLNAMAGSEVMEVLETGWLTRQKVLRLLRGGGCFKAPFIDFEKGNLLAPKMLLKTRAKTQSVESESRYFENLALKGTDNTEISFTNYTNKFKGWLDHVFGVGAPGVILKVESEDPSVLYTVNDFLPDPGKGHGSDHLPLVCKIELGGCPKDHEDETQEDYIVQPLVREEDSKLDEDYVEFTFVDNETSLAETLASLKMMVEKSDNIAFCIDLQGSNVSRIGNIGLLIIKPVPLKVGESTLSIKPWIFDVVSLKWKKSGLPSGIRSLLERDDVLKIFFDVRFDSDALLHLFDTRLANALDLQILDQGIRLSHGEELPERTQSWVPHLPTMSRLGSKYLATATFARLRRPKPFGKQESSAWLSRPMFGLALEFAACQVHVTELLFQAMRTTGTMSIAEMILVETHCRRALEDYRSKESAVSEAATEKNPALEELSIKTKWTGTCIPLLDRWIAQNVIKLKSS